MGEFAAPAWRCPCLCRAVLLPGNAHEVGPFFELVEQFVQTVGKGVIKWLVLDRGFIDGAEISRCKQQWDIEVVIPMKKKMDIWADAWALAQRETWQLIAQDPRRQCPSRPSAQSGCAGARPSGKRRWPKRKQPCHPPPARSATPYRLLLD